jgi:hypothetical protein
MKTRSLSILCALAICLAGTTPAFASSVDPAAIVVDTLAVRPACLVATVCCSAAFVISLPWALMSKSTKRAANSLLVGPAQATFTRPLGDFDALVD